MAAREPGRVILLLSSLLVIDWIFMKFPSATWGFLSVFVLWCSENQVSSRYHFGDESVDLCSFRQTGATSVIPRNGLMRKEHPKRPRSHSLVCSADFPGEGGTSLQSLLISIPPRGRSQLSVECFPTDVLSLRSG